MPATDPTTRPPPQRSPRIEALTARVRSASDAAVEALHAAAADRRFVHEQEWGQSARDTLGDIDEVADALQGFAAWVISGRAHPRRQQAPGILHDLGCRTAFDLRAMPPGERRQCTNLLDYVSRLEDLRGALSDYFEADKSATDPGPDSQT